MKELNAYYWPPIGFPCGSKVKNPPAKQEMWVRSLGQEVLLEKEMATHSSILAWRIPWTEEPGRLQSMRLQRIGHDLVTKQQQHTSFHRGSRAAFWMLPGGSAEGARLIPELTIIKFSGFFFPPCERKLWERLGPRTSEACVSHISL